MLLSAHCGVMGHIDWPCGSAQAWCSSELRQCSPSPCKCHLQDGRFVNKKHLYPFETREMTDFLCSPKRKLWKWKEEKRGEGKESPWVPGSEVIIWHQIPSVPVNSSVSMGESYALYASDSLAVMSGWWGYLPCVFWRLKAVVHVGRSSQRVGHLS